MVSVGGSAAVAAGRQTGPLAYGLLLFMGIAWGLAVACSKIASTSGGHPVGLALWQVSISGTMLLIAALASGRPPSLRRDALRFCLICGVTGVAFPAIALFWCTIHLPAGIVAIAFASMPLFTYLMSVAFAVEPGERRRLLGVIVGLVAMALLVLPEGSLPGPGLAPWVMLALVASLSMSFENFYAGGFRPPGVATLPLSCGRQLGAVLVLVPIALVTGTTVPVQVPWGEVQWAATATGVLSGVAYTTYLHVIRTCGPVFASQSAYVITLAGVAWGMLLFEERHSIFIWLALALTLAAIALVRPQRPRAAVPLPAAPGVLPGQG
jgi:drug/metabolite transporter (DMT)-like permease